MNMEYRFGIINKGIMIRQNRRNNKGLSYFLPYGTNWREPQNYCTAG